MFIEKYPEYIFHKSGCVYRINKYTIDLVPARINKDGYLRINIKDKNGVYTSLEVHKLIIECYSPDFEKYKNKDNNISIDHVDNNKLNNSLSNLQLISQKQNIKKYHYMRVQKNGLPSNIYFLKRKNKYYFKTKEDDLIIKSELFDTLNEAENAKKKYYDKFFENVKL
tara:strand:+ start:85 stop:588 length:504 start_codon:yes stop_codon:yes gene_type:complete